MQCQLIKLAVAQYGFAAAGQHALETYGPDAVKTGDKCFTTVIGGVIDSHGPESDPSFGVKR